MTKINYLIGDVLEPKTKLPNKLIVHCVNNIYSFGSGVAGAINKKWPHVRDNYMKRAEWSLGDIQYVKIDESLYVVNLCGQRGIHNFYETVPVRYEALQDGFIQVREDLRKKNLFDKVSINMPRLGAGLAGGEWVQIEEVILRVFSKVNIELNVYTLEHERYKFCWPVYDRTYGDDKECKCGHPYYRHFDGYEDDRAAGCKYCECDKFVQS